MSAIAGMICWTQKEFDSQPLFTMSRAMLLRGGAQRRAYLHGSVALVQNDEKTATSKFPLTLTEDGNPLSAVIDGTPRLLPSGEDLGEALYDPTDASTLLRAYRLLGNTLADALDGEFALAIADEKRGELYLAKDRNGSRPIFYYKDERAFFFASELRALLRTQGGLFRIDAGALRTHLISPCGTYFAEDLYRDANALPDGYSAVFSRLGLRLFPNQPKVPQASPSRVSAIPFPEFYVPEEEELASMLTELLFAFETPEFDYLMPTLLHDLSMRRERGTPSRLIIEDPTLCMSVRYAQTRADRIGTMKKLTLIPTVPERFFVKERDLRRLEKTMRSLLASTDTAVLRSLLGETWDREILREKNTVSRIRREAMAYQTLLWIEHFPLLLS
ncbi:MAG: hypothetical protein IJD64_04595 [Clostridia bacterium]|nr:hypothetical protein [Clostridia bacterium]